MIKNASFILTSRVDLLPYQIETFYYRGKSDNDLFVVVDDKRIDKQDVISVIQTHSNPNFIPSNVLTISEINLRVSNILDLNDIGIETLNLYKMCGYQSPVIYLQDLGYENILMLEDDMLVVGPIDELIDNDKEFAHNSWSTKTYPSWDKELKYKGKQDNKLYELLGVTQPRWDNIKEFYKDLILRAPYKWGSETISIIKSVLKTYLESEHIRDTWKFKGDSDTSRNGIPYVIFHHNDILNQLAFFLAWKSNPKKVLGRCARSEKVIGNDIIKNNDFQKQTESCMKEYVIHAATGKHKLEVFKGMKKVMDNIGYDGENSPKSPMFFKSRKMKIDNHWYINNTNLTDKERDDYATGRWLSKRACIDDMMRTKSGREKLKKTMKLKKAIEQKESK